MSDQLAEQDYQYQAQLRAALELIEEALDILDLARAPDDVAASLEQGRHCLYSHLDTGASV